MDKKSTITIRFLTLLTFTIVSVLSYAQKNPNITIKDPNKTPLGEILLTPEQKEIKDSISRANTGKNEGSARDRVIYKNRYKDSIQVYKIIDFKNDTSFVDTTLRAANLYKINPLRHDEFGYMPYPNLAEGYTPMIFDSKAKLTPEYGFRSRSMYYLNTEEVDYYDLRTPWSEVMYLTNLFSSMTGQVLDFKFAVNINKQLNISVGFRGKKTFGLYNYIESGQGQLVSTFNYHTKNNRYRTRGHITYQYLANGENGGLTQEGMDLFTSGEKEFSYRLTLPVNLSGSDGIVSNRLGGTRFFFEQAYDLFGTAITRPNAFRISLLNQVQYQHLTYKYFDPAFKNPESSTGEKSIKYYGSNVLKNAPIVDSSMFNTLEIAAGAGIHFPLVNLYTQGMIKWQNATYEFPNYIDDQSIPNRSRDGSTFSLNLMASLRPIKYFGADATFDYNISGVFADARIMSFSGYIQVPSIGRLEGRYSNASYYPSLASTYYRSSFENFNWSNDFARIASNELSVRFSSKLILDAEVKFTDIKNYVYYNSEGIPVQHSDNINIFTLTLSRDLRVRWFGWDNTILYQKVTSGADIIPMPELIVRSTVYASLPLFRKAITLMPSATLNYFSAFKAPHYNPLLSDYKLQGDNPQMIGNYPFIDISLSAKIRRTRFYFRFENAGALLLSSQNYFSGPSYPYLDPTLRFGIVWDWFN